MTDTTPSALRPDSTTPDEENLALFRQGNSRQIQSLLGAHPQDGQSVRFAVWAPNARSVCVAGDFNGWDPAAHPLAPLEATGIWQTTIGPCPEGSRYKFVITGPDGETRWRADPCARQSEIRPDTASVVTKRSQHLWQDQIWLERRSRSDWHHAPVAIYEVHPGSWRRHLDGHFYSYRELAYSLVPYVRDLGFTHIELMPLTEHPLDESWGYQTTGYFAPTSRYGSPDDLRFLVDYCHKQGLGVILDWVPGHFPMDTHALAMFDGTPLYEYDDPSRQLHPQWGTLVFDFGSPHVCDFLISSALFWLDEFHIDGLRVDAVASMLYLDFGRRPEEWRPNASGGNENPDAVMFLRNLNEQCRQRHPDVLMIAEDSTSWPGVTHPIENDGLGFHFKWNLGWMNDTLRYLALDPLYRRHHHELLTFGLLYAFSEHFLLPLSHDEVVHEKASLVSKMPGDRWQQLANLRLLYLFMYGYPGAKLLFMGNEFAQRTEWNALAALDWSMLQQDEGRGIHQLVGDLNRLYREHAALWSSDRTCQGFKWLDCHDNEHSVISFVRRQGADELLFVLNFTPVPRNGYRIPVPSPGYYRECLNTDSRYYGGTDLGNPLGAASEPVHWKGENQSLVLTLPPLGGVVLKTAAAN